MGKRGKNSFDPEDFDLEAEVETGLVIGDSRGGGYRVTLDGKYVDSSGDFDEALTIGLAAMEHAKYYPNVFYVNERGNIDLLAVSPKTRKGKIVGASYETLHSWV
jgi:hypothetical protein